MKILFVVLFFIILFSQLQFIIFQKNQLGRNTNRSIKGTNKSKKKKVIKDDEEEEDDNDVATLSQIVNQVPDNSNLLKELFIGESGGYFKSEFPHERNDIQFENENNNCNRNNNKSKKSTHKTTNTQLHNNKTQPNNNTNNNISLDNLDLDMRTVKRLLKERDEVVY